MKSFVVCGLGRFGYSIAIELYKAGNDVVAMDTNEELVNEIQDKVSYAVIGNCADEAALKSLGVSNFDAAIVTIGEDVQTSVLCTVILKELGIPYIIACARDEMHSKILLKVGADKIIMPERDMGIKFAQSLSSDNIIDIIDISDDFSIIEISIAKRWVGKSIGEIEFRSKYGVNVIAVKTKTGVVITPGAGYVFADEDVLVIVGENANIDKVRVLK